MFLLYGLMLLMRAGAIDPEYAVNLTVYHQTLNTSGLIPINQNTGDFRGFMAFNMFSTFSRFSCLRNFTADWCDNPEAFGPADRMVITELTLEVDSRFGPYSKCNLCQHGHDPYEPQRRCRANTYTCACGVSGASVAPPKVPKCESPVGHADVAVYEIPSCDPSTTEEDCWEYNMGHKIGGNWYATHDSGQCGGHHRDGNCTWRVVTVEKRIAKECADAMILGAVEAHNPKCFQWCGPRRLASGCWARCFTATVLGPHAGMQPDVSGIPLAGLIDIWSRPFRDPSEGGCPRLPVASDG